MPATFAPPDSSLRGGKFSASQTHLWIKEWLNEWMNEWMKSQWMRVVKIEVNDIAALDHTVSGILYGQEFSALTQSPSLLDSLCD